MFCVFCRAEKLQNSFIDRPQLMANDVFYNNLYLNVSGKVFLASMQFVETLVELLNYASICC